MKIYSLAIGCGVALALMSGSAFAQHGGRHAMIGMPMMPATTTQHTSQGSTQGAGWNHMNGPTHPTGQPNVSCGSAGAPFTPGNAASAPGSAFNPSGNAGTVYAGQQPQNSRNVASVAQYDSACAHQK